MQAVDVARTEQPFGDRHGARDRRPDHHVVAAVSGCDRHRRLRVPQIRAAARRGVWAGHRHRSHAAARRLHSVPGRSRPDRLSDRHLGSVDARHRRQLRVPGSRLASATTSAPPAKPPRSFSRAPACLPLLSGRASLSQNRFTIATPLAQLTVADREIEVVNVALGKTTHFFRALPADDQRRRRQRRRDHRDRHRRERQPANADARFGRRDRSSTCSSPSIRAHARRSRDRDQEPTHRRRFSSGLGSTPRPPILDINALVEGERGRPVRGRSQRPAAGVKRTPSFGVLPYAYGNGSLLLRVDLPARSTRPSRRSTSSTRSCHPANSFASTWRRHQGRPADRRARRRAAPKSSPMPTRATPRVSSAARSTSRSTGPSTRSTRCT